MILPAHHSHRDDFCQLSTARRGQVKFDTACFHPNVDTAGNICLDILKVRPKDSRGGWQRRRLRVSFFSEPSCHNLQDKWSAAYSVRTLLISIQSLLGEPNNESPLNSFAATLWDNEVGLPRRLGCELVYP